MSSKAEARKHFIQQRRRFVENFGDIANQQIFERMLGEPVIQKAKSIHIFVSLNDEVDTHRFIEKSLRLRKQIIVPRVKPHTSQLTHHQIESMSCLIPGTFGVLEPDPEKCPEIDPAQAELVIVPGLAFDWKGNRLGYGKGFYDRFLAQFPGLKIGIGFSIQFVEWIPSEAHDIPLDCLLTENEFTNFSSFSLDVPA